MSESRCEINYSKIYEELGGHQIYKLAEKILKNARLGTYTSKKEAYKSVERQMFIEMSNENNQRLVFEYYYHECMNSKGVSSVTDLSDAVQEFSIDLWWGIWNEDEEKFR